MTKTETVRELAIWALMGKMGTTAQILEHIDKQDRGVLALLEECCLSAFLAGFNPLQGRPDALRKLVLDWQQSGKTVELHDYVEVVFR